MINIIIANILAISLIFNIVLGIFVYKLHKKSKQKKPDATAQEVLAEILAGPAIIKVEIVERDSIIQWRPD